MARTVKKKRRRKINILSLIHEVQNFFTLLCQFMKLVGIVSVFIIGRMDFYVRENWVFDYNDIALSFGSYKDSYLINRIVEMNFTDVPDEEPLPEPELSTIASETVTSETATSSNSSRSGTQFVYNVTVPLDIYVDDTPFVEKLKVSYSAYVIYFIVDLINNMVIFYTLERRHYKTLFLFQAFDALWILICFTVNFYCCIYESLLFKCFVVLLVALFIFVDFLSS